MTKFTRIEDAQEAAEARSARGLVDQQGQELPFRYPQQEQGWQPQQEQRLSRLPVSRHKGEGSPLDVAHSRALNARKVFKDETAGKSSPVAAIRAGGVEKAAGEALRDGEKGPKT